MVVVLLALKKNLDIVVVLLAFLKIQKLLLSCWHFEKKSKHGCRPAGTFKIKSPDTVVVLLEFLSNTTHVLLASSYFIKIR